MIVVRLLGGLGNQMFQYALGRTLSLQNKDILKVDTTILEDHRPGVHAVNRNYDLDVFTLELPKSTHSEIWKFHSHNFPLPYKIASRLYNLIMGPTTVNEPHFHFAPAILSRTGTMYLNGLWQSYKYFQSVEAEIRRDFTFRQPLTGEALEIAAMIQRSQAVCLNVRRTDYITDKATSSVVTFTGLKYYRDAVDLIESQHKKLHYFIFSDDMEWCKNNFNFLGDDITFVDHTYAGPKFSFYLQLMSMCKHFIIPNSTFAWWAAWLNEDTGKIVVTPKKWMNDPSVETGDLIPDNWIRI